MFIVGDHMNKDKKMLLGVGIVFLFLATVGFSYAYFSNAIANKDVKDQVVQTGTLELTYTDGPEIIMNIIKPGATITKEISVKNTGTLDTSYNLVWQELVNEIIKDEIVIEATCTRLNANGVEEGTCENLETTPIGKTKIKENITIEPNIVHKYDITITFKEINEAQNYNQGKKFSGVLGVKEYKTPEPVYCTFDGELTQGAEYVNGQYTYRYKQEGVYASSGLGWNNITTDGWGVQLTDRTSTEPVTSKLCTYINDKTVVSMSWMFLSSQATTIDLSSFNTSNVTYMHQMFYGCSSLRELDLSNFNLINCTNADRLFEGCTSLTTINSPLNLSIDCALPSIQGKEWVDTNDNDKVITTLPKGLSVSHTITIRNAVITGVEFPSDWKDQLLKVGVDFKSMTQLGLDSDISQLEKYFKLAGTIGNEINVYTFTPDPSNVVVVIATKNSMYLTDKASSLFSDCVNVRQIQILNLDTSRTTNMQYMFSGNSNLSQIDLGTFDFTNVTDYTNMFNNVPADCQILVKDEAAKTWITSKFPLTNVKIK